ncbi:MAG: hypothetical protein OCD76_12945 [Reichenbachiella sp.]
MIFLFRSKYIGRRWSWRLAFLGLTFCCLLPFHTLLAQEDSLRVEQDQVKVMFDELDALFLEGDAEVLFEMVDSILAAEPIKISSLHPRLSYISQVTTAGRDLDIEQYGLSAGATYYHHSGFFGDVSGFLNSEYDPNYYLTSASVGYMYSFKNLLTTSLSHDFYFYNDTLSNRSFDKSVSFNSYLDYKFLNFGVDYMYLYGGESAHRINTRLGIDIRFEEVWFMDRVSLHPNFSVQWGNADVVYYRQSDTPLTDLNQIITNGDYPNLRAGELRKLVYLLTEERYMAAANFLGSKGYDAEEITMLNDDYQGLQINDENVFGIMNYSFSLPIIFSLTKDLTLMTAYTYNIPVALPNETFEYENNGFLSMSLTYKFLFVR